MSLHWKKIIFPYLEYSVNCLSFRKIFGQYVLSTYLYLKVPHPYQVCDYFMSFLEK